MPQSRYLPKSSYLYGLPPNDRVLMQQLWKVMDDLQNGVEGAISVANSAASSGVQYPIPVDGSTITGGTNSGDPLVATSTPSTPAGSNTEIQYNNAGAFGADAGFTVSASQVLIERDQTGTTGALLITKGDAVNQYIVLEEDTTVPDFVYLTFKSSGGNAIAMGMEASGGAPVRYIFTDPSAAILQWLDITTGDVGITNLGGGGTQMVTADNTGILGTAAIPVGLTDGDKGDITVSATGATWTIDNDVVTFAKMQNIATDRLLGRDTAASGDVEEISLGQGLSWSGAGSILTRSSFLIAYSGTVSSTNTISEESLASLLIPANTLETGDLIQIEVVGRKTSGVAANTFRVRIHTASGTGGTEIANYATTAQQSYVMGPKVLVTGAATQIGWPAFSNATYTVGSANTTSPTLAISSDIYINITNTKITGTDGFDLRAATVIIQKYRT